MTGMRSPYLAIGLALLQLAWLPPALAEENIPPAYRVEPGSDPAMGMVSAALLILQTPRRKRVLPSEGHCLIRDAASGAADTPCAHLTLIFEDADKKTGVRIQTDGVGAFILPPTLARARAIRIRSQTFNVEKAEITPLDAKRSRLDLIIAQHHPKAAP